MDNIADEALPEGIAIIGMAGRFPQAKNCDEFWANLVAGRECLTHFTDEDLRNAGIDPNSRSGAACRFRGVVDDADQFDAALFGLSPKEAAIMDPQQRVLLEVAWESLEHAGYDHARPPGPIGVFVGSGINTYFMSNLGTRPDVLEQYGIFPTVLLNEKDFLATRLAYRLNLKGPALNVQTACSTSLVAVCNACQSLLSYECDMALAGAAHIAFPQCQSHIHIEGGMISQDGHCRPFDQNASGTIFSDGVGTVVLRRLEDAIADRDNVIAVIRGYGVNNDGADKAGFTAPSVSGQADVVQMAHAFGGIDPSTISYIEAHGTGTRLGDPIEIAGLAKAFGTRTDRKQYCGIGSVKANIGHLDVAAGVAGLIKTSLALQHRTLPPTINFDKPNPQVDFSSTPFYVVDSMSEWESREGPRRAGVSSFGIGGTNAHVVLEETPAIAEVGARGGKRPARPYSLLTLSAQTPEAVAEAAINLADHLEKEAPPLSDVAYTLQKGRHRFAERRTLVCRDRTEAIELLRSTGVSDIAKSPSRARCGNPIFMFPGQGSQRVNMGRDLYDHEPVYREAIDQCAGLLEPELHRDIRDILFPSDLDKQEAEDLLVQTWITQPALFVTEYALAQLWQSWGVRPHAMIGHSVGEYAAACLADVFTLEVALRLIATRGRLIQGQPRGSMLAIMRSEEECQRFLSDSVSIAAVNAPSLCVVSGETEQIDSLADALQRESITCRRLRTSHAFHSPMMEPVIEPFEEVVSQAELNPPSIPFVSNVSGDWIKDDEATNPSYWTNHLRYGVMFAKGIKTILDLDGVALIEVGPGHTLSTLTRQHPTCGIDQVIATSLPIARAAPDSKGVGTDVSSKPASDQANVLTALGQLWRADVPIDWSGFYQGEVRVRVPLPTYPFQRSRHWIAPRIRTADGDATLPVSSVDAVPDLSVSECKDPPVSKDGQSQQRSPDANVTTEDELIEVLQDLSGIDPDVLRIPGEFLQMGFDSLFLTQLARAIHLKFGIPITFRQVAEDTGTVKKLAEFIEANRPPESKSTQLSTTVSPTSVGSAPSQGSGMDRLEQRIAEMALQIARLTEAVQGRSEPGSTNGVPAPIQASSEQVQVLPLTDGQREIWLASQLGEDASRTFNESYAVTLKGKLRVPFLTDCIGQLVDRHDALRTTFQEDGAAQRILPNNAQNVELVDLSSDARFREGDEAELMLLIQARVEVPFDLEQGPLSRFVVFKLSESHHVLLIVFHHIVLDGWSWGTLLSELGELYQSKENGREPSLGKPARYADYVDWTHSASQVAKSEADGEYWRNVFGKDIRELQLPSDHIRPAEKTYVAGHFSSVIDESLTTRLRESSRSHRCTLFSFMLAGFKVWLQRLTHQEDIVVGVPVAGQLAIDCSELPSGQELVGHCVSMLPIRSECSADSSFEDVLREVHANVMEGRDHQAFTFGNLLETLKLKRDASRVPIVSVSFNLVKAHSCNLGDLETDVVRPPKAFNYFDLTLDVIDCGGHLTLDCKFNRDMFEAASVEDWMSQLRRVFEQTVTESIKPLSRFSLMDNVERERLLIELNETRMDYDPSATIHELFTRQARLTPDAVAVIFGAEELTFKQLDERSSQLANYLRDTVDVGPDVLVGVCLDRSLDMLVALLAVLKSGAAYVPLDPAYPADRISYILEDSQAAAIITQERLCEDLGSLSVPTICIDVDRGDIESRSAESKPSPSDGTNLAYVIYTSGSTGKPKGVQIEHRAALNFLESMGQQPGLSSKDVLLAVTTISFDIAVLELYLPLLKGATVVLAPREMAIDGNALQQAIATYGVSIMQATPATWRMMLKSGWNGSKSLKVLCGGEPLPTELARELVPICAELWNMYGPTETTVWSTCSQVHDPEDIHIGKPIGNTQVYIVDDQLQPTPVGVAGELMIGGDGLARGYRGRPELTEEKFIESPFISDAKIYRTGDLAKYRRDGAIDCLGRVDFQVKIRGFRIELGEIETVLAEAEGVRQAVVVARKDGSGEDQLVAYYVAATPERPPAMDELRAALREKLPDYMVPAMLVPLQGIPTTPNGKVDRKSLPEPGAIEPSVAIGQAPRTLVESSLARIWQKCLRMPSVDVHSSFFDLGGHSLLAVTVFNEIEQQFGYRLPLGVLIKSPTIAGLAEVIEAKRQNQGEVFPSLLPMNSMSTSNQNIYLVHGAGGDVLLYRQLVQQFGDQFGIYGLQSQGIDGDTPPLTTIEEMARHYVSEIRLSQPVGPYHIAGYCLGGTIAFEMARLLREEGQDVKLLALLDTYNFQKMRKPGFLSVFSQRLYFHVRNLLRTPFRNWPSYLTSKFQVMRSGELRLMLRATLPRFFGRRQKENLSTAMPILDRNQAAAFEYAPEPYSGVLTIIKPKSNYSFFPGTHMGWEELASSLDVVELDAMPHAMLEEPVVKQLAAQIAQRIGKD